MCGYLQYRTEMKVPIGSPWPEMSGLCEKEEKKINRKKIMQEKIKKKRGKKNKIDEIRRGYKQKLELCLPNLSFFLAGSLSKLL